MKKLYLISNYHTSLNELDENGMCISIDKITQEKTLHTQEFIINRFLANPTVKVYGILHSMIIEKEDVNTNNWVFNEFKIK